MITVIIELQSGRKIELTYEEMIEMQKEFDGVSGKRKFAPCVDPLKFISDEGLMKEFALIEKEREKELCCTLNDDDTSYDWMADKSSSV